MATWPTIIDDDGSGTTGTVLDAALFQQIKAYIDTVAPASAGTWQLQPFNAADFTGAGGLTWTVNTGAYQLNRYTVINKTLLWAVYIAGGVLGGTPSNALYMTIPGGYSATNPHGPNATAQLYDGVHQAGFVSVEAAGTKLRIQKITEANFSLGASYIRFSTILEVT